MSRSSVVLVAGENQKLLFTVTDKSSGNAVDLSSGTSFALSVLGPSGELFAKADGAFEKAEAASGVLTVACDFATEGRYNGVFTITFSGGTIKKHRFGVVIEGAD